MLGFSASDHSRRGRSHERSQDHVRWWRFWVRRGKREARSKEARSESEADAISCLASASHPGLLVPGSARDPDSEPRATSRPTDAEQGSNLAGSSSNRSMCYKNIWGGQVKTSNAGDKATDGSRSGDVYGRERAAPPHYQQLRFRLEDIQQSWLLSPTGILYDTNKYVDLGCMIVRRKRFNWTVRIVLACCLLAGFLSLIINIIPYLNRSPPPPDNYMLALHKALMFFNAQRSGPLPINNNVPWRGNSGMEDGKFNPSPLNNLVGGYYDAGDAVKFNFPAAFAMTMLSWSVIEYSAKYDAIGELGHVKEIIKWGTDYLIKTFDSSSGTINKVASQVGLGNVTSQVPNDHYCWMKPEDMDYPRPVAECTSCSDLAAEMAAALASASIVFKDNKVYSEKLIHGAETLWKFARQHKGRYSDGADAALFYNSSSYWDEFVWGGAWLYFATGNNTYLSLVTSPELAKLAGAFWGNLDKGVLSWDNKLVGAQVLLSRLRLFLNPGYPYEEILSTYHNQTSSVMCSYLPSFTFFKRSRGGLIQLNHGKPQPLQYAVNAAFLASVFSDYLKTANMQGWYCGQIFYSTDVLRNFAKSQINYVLGKNPQKISYVVGFGDRYPIHVHHRGASIPKNGIKYTCKGGWKWRDTNKPNPNTIVGAMVAGPDRYDGFDDSRSNYNYTEPTLAGNAGLVAALISLSSEKSGLDKNTIFFAVPSVFSDFPPPSAEWDP